jgi:glutathione peroxidase
MAQLYSKHASSGLEILAFPSNEFGGQEPGTNEQIQAFAKARGATYPVFGKTIVNGDIATPLYVWLRSQKGGALSIFGDSIKWNFGKFLLDRHGKLISRYAPTTSPMSIEGDILKLLKVRCAPVLVVVLVLVLAPPTIVLTLLLVVRDVAAGTPLSLYSRIECPKI